MKNILIILAIFLMNSVFARTDFKSVECALTFRIIHFTDISATSGDYNLCVDGDDEIFSLLKKQLVGQKFKGGNLNIYKTTEFNLEKCSLVYLGPKGQIDKGDIRKKIKNNKLLVFSANKSLKEISLVFFEQINDKIEFKVNKTLLDKSEINMSSKVLRLASEVY